MMGRPLTHDLFTTILNELGSLVERVIIEEIAQNTFFATLHLEMDKNGKREKRSFDARPSDCLALAVRSGAQVLVRRKVLDAAAVDRAKLFGTPPFAGAPEGEHEEEEAEEEEEDDDEDDPERGRRGRRPPPFDPSEAEKP